MSVVCSLDTSEVGAKGGAMASQLWLRRGPLRAGLRQRRSPGCYRLETDVSFGARGMQGFAGGFSCRS